MKVLLAVYLVVQVVVATMPIDSKILDRAEELSLLIWK